MPTDGEHDRPRSAPARRLDADHSRTPATAQRVLDVLRVDVEPVRQDDDVPLAARRGRDSPASSRWPMSPVRYQPSGVRVRPWLGILPVALEHGRPAELDLAVGARAASRSPRAAGRPCPRPWSSSVVHAARPGLGRAVALEDRDAEVLPRLLERRRQERAGRQEEPEVPAELRMDAAEEARGETRSGRWRAIGRRRSKAAVRPRFSTSRSIALQNRSRTWGTTTIEVTRCSRRASKMTRGFRLRTYRTSAPTDERVERARPPARAGATGAGATRSGAPSAGRSGGTSRSRRRRCRGRASRPWACRSCPR